MNKFKLHSIDGKEIDLGDFACRKGNLLTRDYKYCCVCGNLVNYNGIDKVYYGLEKNSKHVLCGFASLDGAVIRCVEKMRQMFLDQGIDIPIRKFTENAHVVPR
jgi:hypothetical protein